MIDTLDVILWNRKIGTLISTKKGYRNEICFYFDPEYAKNGMDFAPLRAPLAGIAAQRGLPVYPESEREFGGLPSFISDSLPDHWGNVLFSEWAKTHNIHNKDLSPLDRLAYIGRRGMGALEFVPPVTAEI
jgi:serine/threonine-protein kinase HipA